MKTKFKKLLISFNSFFVFFVFIAFVITCCLMLFVQTLMHTMHIEFTEADISNAAKLTFVNVILFSVIVAVIDAVRRKYTVDRPTKRITDAAQKMMQGDFSVQIEPVQSFEAENRFNEIIECFNSMARELSSTETLRSDFIANVSHELKTPLAVIGNYATMLQMPDLPEEKRLEYAAVISGATHRLADLISNILKLNKLENQQIFPDAETYDLGEQLCECLLSFEDAWQQKNLEIVTEIEDGVLVHSDREMLSIVWNNLFSNAVKFTGEGGQITLSVSSHNGHAIVRIADTGCGISREVGAHIFEKFYQGDTSHAAQGNGLGLALVKRIIDITGSDISVESELGKGTTFIVKIQRV